MSTLPYYGRPVSEPTPDTPYTRPTSGTTSAFPTRANQTFGPMTFDLPRGAGISPDTAAPTPDTTLADVTAQLLIAAILAEYGLGGVGLEAMLGEWITGGITDPILLRQLIEQTQQFKDRFPAMALRQQQGLGKISAAEYVAFENYAAGLFQEWGLPPGFYDERTDFTDFIANMPDLAQGRASLQRRVQGSFVVVASAPQEIRDAFASYFGPSGDAALASYVLDPDRSLPALEAQVTLAEIGGTGRQFGFDIGLSLADTLRGRGVTGQSARAGFGQVQDLAPTFNETISERQDYTAEGEGFGAVFRLDPNALDKIERRVEARRAAFSGGGGFLRGQGGGLQGLGSGR